MNFIPYPKTIEFVEGSHQTVECPVCGEHIRSDFVRAKLGRSFVWTFPHEADKYPVHYAARHLDK